MHLQKQPSQVFCKITCSWKIHKIHSCFPVNFVKFLRTHISIEHFWRLLLSFVLFKNFFPSAYVRNNYSNIFIVLGALKSLFCFPLDIDINYILKYRTNYLRRKCRKKAIANKQDFLSTLLLIVAFHEITIKYESELKTQFAFVRYFYEQ